MESLEVFDTVNAVLLGVATVIPLPFVALTFLRTRRGAAMVVRGRHVHRPRLLASALLLMAAGAFCQFIAYLYLPPGSGTRLSVAAVGAAFSCPSA